MTLDEFVETYIGTQVGDGQCVYLIRQYCEDVLNLTYEPVGNAHQFYDDYETTPFLYNNFDKITYNLVNVPQTGDIVVWSTAVGGGYGHVAIAYADISLTSFISFDQNWNTPLKCNLESHSYSNVLGWLRPKNTPPVPPTPTKAKSKFPWVLYSKKLRNKSRFI